MTHAHALTFDVAYPDRGRFPRPIFDYLVGVGRWSTRVVAYAFMLVTDDYPPFRLRA